ncbi:MAG: relaxase/mobilization nuclease domain-containing protein, partial [Acutalibacter sp.]|nr:relaxase/mobilization nuclease domain-containing protein [Acutalibacter sp.]
MATTRIMSLHSGKGRTVGKAIQDIIDYVENPDKTDGGRLISSYQCDSRIADAEFLLSKRQYLARTGRRRGADDVIAYTIRQSFVPGEITPEEANRLGYELVRRFTKGKHAFIVCTHVDKAHIHNHIIWNSTTLDHDRKFRDFFGSGRAVRRLNDTICVQNDYSIVENPKRRGKSYNKWLGSKPPCHRDQLRMAIDDALTQKPADLDTLLKLLRDAGIEVSPRGKSIRLKAPGRKNFVRL